MKEITFQAKRYTISAYVRDFFRVTSLQKFFVVFSILLLTGFSSWSQSITVNGDPGDWEILEASDPAVFNHIEDPFGNGVVDNQFTEGSKDFNVAADLIWADGQTKAKNDIANAAAYLEGTTLYFAGDKTSNNGDAQIGFWFYLNNTAPRVLQTSPTRGGDFYPEHAVGDILVLIDFTGGGKFGTVTSYVWVGVGEGDYGNNKSLDLAGAGNVAQNNLLEFPVPDGWKFISDTYDQNQFFEGSINLANLEINDACFSRFLVEARSSQELTASLDDFAAGEFNVEPQASVNDITACENDGPFILTAIADGGLGTLEYEWRKLPSNEIIGTTSTLNVTESGQYSVIILGQGVFGGKCPSQPAIATVDLQPGPDLSDPTDEFCFDEQTDKLLSDYNTALGAGAGDDVDWYSNSDRTISATSTGGALAVGDHTFYATVTNSDDCSADGTLVITINAAPSLTNQTDEFCFDEQTDKLLSDYNTALGAGAGDDVDWYSNSDRTISATSTGGALAVGDHTFYATVTNSDGCDTDGTLVITINAAPSLTNQTDEFCFDEQTDKLLSDYNTALGAGAGDDVDWYSNFDRTISATSTGGALAVGDHTFYATVTNSDGCDTDGTLVITINAAPSLTNQTDEFCFDEQTDKLLSDYNTALGAGAGDDVDWYSNSDRTISVTSTGGALAVGDHTFYATVTNSDGCDTDGTLVITINTAPSLTNQTDEFCFDEQTDKLLSDYNTALGAGAGDDVDWYSNSDRTISATSTGGALAVGDHTFYATVTSGENCTSDGTLVITINAAPSLTNQTDEFCFDEQTDKLLSDYNTALGAGAGDDVDWYSNSDRTISATSTGGVLAVGDHTFYATVTNSDGCDTDGTLVITIHPLPILETDEPQLTCFGEKPSIAVTSSKDGLEFKLEEKGLSDGTFADYTGPFTDLKYDTDYVLTARDKTTGCETEHEFKTDIQIDIPAIVQLTVNSPTCGSYDGSTYFGSIQIDNHVPGYLYAVVDQATFVDIESVPASAYMNYDGTSGLISGVAVGEYYVIAKSPDGCLSAIAPAILLTPDCLTCETAFAKPEGPDNDSDQSYCFIDDNVPGYSNVLNEQRWGWTNGYDKDTYITWAESPLELILYAGAGQCDITKGEIAGTVTVTFIPTPSLLDSKYAGSFTVEYEALYDDSSTGWFIEGGQFYIGEAPYPVGKGKNKEYTVAPGQYNWTIDVDAGLNVVAPPLSNNGVDYIYIIAHAEACRTNTVEYAQELRSEAETQYFTVGKNNNTIVYGEPTKGGKTQVSSTSTSSIESSEPIFSIAPVPFKDVLNIGYLFDYTSDVTIQVFDLNGRLLTTYKDTAVNSDSISTFNVDFRTKSNQIYIVRMTTDREVYSAKIISAK